MGLHNRVTGRIFLEPFTLAECETYFRTRGVRYERKQIADCYMAFGGIPFYLRLMDKARSLPQNIDRLCFGKAAPLAGEFEELYHSLFRNPNRHIGIVRALAKKHKGLTREEIIAEAGIPPGGGLTKTLEDLEQCGFVRRYREFTKPKSGYLYRLVDPFTLFWLRFMDGGGREEGYWSKRIDSAARAAWAGYAFELVCFLHVPQIKRALGIAGVATEESSWRSVSAEPGAQVDLVIDRRDMTINLCEIKHYAGAFAIDKKTAASLERKRHAFQEETRTKKDLHLTMVTTFGVKPNAYSHILQSEVTADDLFAP